MKISKVKSVQGNGTYESAHGLLYNFEYTFEDGQVMNANHKAQTPLDVGTEVEYIIKGSNDRASWGAVKKVSNYTKPGAPQPDLKGVKIGHAISNATQLVIAQGKASNSHPEIYIKEMALKILKIQEELFNEI